MSLQYGEDDEDDLFDSTEEDEEEAENELSGEPPPKSGHAPMSMHRAAQMVRQGGRQGGRRLRMRPMKPSMAAKHPNVVTILLTHSDGRQIMFVRK